MKKERIYTLFETLSNNNALSSSEDGAQVHESNKMLIIEIRIHCFII